MGLMILAVLFFGGGVFVSTQKFFCKGDIVASVVFGGVGALAGMIASVLMALPLERAILKRCLTNGHLKVIESQLCEVDSVIVDSEKGGIILCLQDGGALFYKNNISLPLEGILVLSGDDRTTIQLVSPVIGSIKRWLFLRAIITNTHRFIVPKDKIRNGDIKDKNMT